MGYPQPPTPVAMDNTAENSIVNGTAKQKTSRVIDLRYYWVRDRIQQNHFRIFWEEGKKTQRIISKNTIQSDTIEQ